MARSFPQDDQTYVDAIAEAAEAGAWTDIAPTDAIGTLSAQPLFKFVPPRPQGIPPDVMMIFKLHGHKG